MAETTAETNGTKTADATTEPTELEQKIIRQVEVRSTLYLNIV